MTEFCPQTSCVWHTRVSDVVYSQDLFRGRTLLIRISILIPPSLNLLCKLNGIRSLRNKMFLSVVFGVIRLTILKQLLLNLTTFNHFKVVKCLPMTKTKHLRKVKQNRKRLFSAFFFVTFSKVGTIRQKANHADRSNSKTE